MPYKTQPQGRKTWTSTHSLNRLLAGRDCPSLLSKPSTELRRNAASLHAFSLAAGSDLDAKQHASKTSFFRSRRPNVCIQAAASVPVPVAAPVPVAPAPLPPVATTGPAQPSSVPRRLLLVDCSSLLYNPDTAEQTEAPQPAFGDTPAPASSPSSSSTTTAPALSSNPEAALAQQRATALSRLAAALRLAQPDAVLFLSGGRTGADAAAQLTWRDALSYLRPPPVSGDDWPVGEAIWKGNLDLGRLAEDLVEILPAHLLKPSAAAAAGGAAAVAAAAAVPALGALREALERHQDARGQGLPNSDMRAILKYIAAVAVEMWTAEADAAEAEEKDGAAANGSVNGATDPSTLLASSLEATGLPYAVLQRPGLSASCLAGLAVQQAVRQGTEVVRILSTDEHVLQLVGRRPGAAGGGDGASGLTSSSSSSAAAATAHVGVLRWGRDGRLIELSDDALVHATLSAPPPSLLPAHLLADYWALAGHADMGLPKVPGFGPTRARQAVSTMARLAVHFGVPGGAGAIDAYNAVTWLQNSAHGYGRAMYGAVVARALGAGPEAPLGGLDDGGKAAAAAESVLQAAAAAAGPAENGAASAAPGATWSALLARAAVPDAAALAAAVEERVRVIAAGPAAEAPQEQQQSAAAAAVQPVPVETVVEPVDQQAELQPAAQEPVAKVKAAGTAEGAGKAEWEGKWATSVAQLRGSLPDWLPSFAGSTVGAAMATYLISLVSRQV